MYTHCIALQHIYARVFENDVHFLYLKMSDLKMM